MPSLNTFCFWSFLLAVSTLVEASYYFDPLVLCRNNGDNTSSPICAYRSYMLPDPNFACYQPGNTNCTYVGSYMVTFFFVHNVTNGTQVSLGSDYGKYDAGFSTEVSWGVRAQDNGTCTARVNATTFCSCSICSIQNQTFSVDCSNRTDGLRSRCEPLLPVFYPLNVSLANAVPDPPAHNSTRKLASKDQVQKRLRSVERACG